MTHENHWTSNDCKDEQFSDPKSNALQDGHHEVLKRAFQAAFSLGAAPRGIRFDSVHHLLQAKIYISQAAGGAQDD